MFIHDSISLNFTYLQMIDQEGRKGEEKGKMLTFFKGSIKVFVIIIKNENNKTIFLKPKNVATF